jgi:hypothetical protein
VEVRERWVDAGEMESGGGGIADGDKGSGGEGHGRQEIVMRWRGSGGGAIGAHVNDGTFEKTLRALLLHPVGGSGKNLGDDAGAAPSNDVLGSSSGALDLSVGGGHVYFNAVVKGEVGRSTMLIKAFDGCCLHVGVVGRSKAVESSGGRAESVGIGLR